jgi:hypothetical protein
MFMNRGGLMRHDERTIRNVDDEIYRIAPRTHGTGAGRMDAREEYARDLREKAYLRSQMNNMAEGGPAMMPPMPMAQPMAQPMPMGQPMLPPEAQVEMTEGAATQQGEQLGQEYLNEMMTGLDTAETTEEVIDAIRGNDKTLQDRYDELANFVGENDASATPESVLAFVQPTIMMTEQGAMDSGIGELMQGIAGEVDMETEEGMAAPMGQGVGELMMAQSVEEVVPQMNQGGYVQNFRLGGEGQASQFAMLDDLLANRQQPSTADQFSEMVQSRLPVYQDLLGNTEDTKNAMQSKLYFDIAQAGLNLASGVDPRTGESMAGRSLGSQFASAAAPVAASAGAMAGERNALDTRAMAGALQSAEASEAARIGDARSMEAALLAGGINRAGQEAGFGQQTSERERTQEFAAGETALSRGLQRELTESDQAHQQRLATERNQLTETLFDKESIRNIDEILERGGVETRLINERGEVQTGLIDTQLIATLKRDGKLNEYDLGMVEARMKAEGELIGLRGLEQRASMRLELQKRAKIAEDEQLHQLEMQRERIAQGESEFSRQLDRLLNNDEFAEELGRDQFAELVRQREALRGGERGIVNAVANDIFGINTDFGVGTTAFDLERDASRLNRETFNLNKKAQKFGFNIQEQALELQQEEASFMQRYRSATSKLNEELARAESERDNSSLNLRGYQAQTNRITALQEMQTDYGSIFGNSQDGIMRGILTDVDRMNSFGSGNLSPSDAAQVITALEYVSRPVTRTNPNTGMSETQVPSLPTYQIEAARNYERNVGPLFKDGGPVIKMAEGGSAFEQRLLQQSGAAIAPTRNPGMIVDETISFEETGGIPSGLKRSINFFGDQVKDVTGLGVGEAYPEVTRGAEQLVAMANMTQRFIRESTTGRPFAVEIEQLAEEIARPGAFAGDERNMIKLQTMRSQLQEIQGIAQGVLDNPQGYDKKMIMDARQDLTQLSPLLDNYNKLINSYEVGLGKKDKPDPSMFEMGAGNAQGSAAGMAIGPRTREELESMEGVDTKMLLAGGMPYGPLATGDVTRAMLGNNKRTGKNLSILGYDTGIDSSAILANQGGPITRRGN